MSTIDVDGYLRRLGLIDLGPPSLDALIRLHRAQVERIPYTTIDIQVGRRTTVDPVASFARVVATGRAGYCYHLNGAFAALLSELGFDVRRHPGGVIDDPAAVPMQGFANHLALTVHGLPEGPFFVDAGLGDALHEPMPLRPGTVTQGPFTFGLDPSPAVEGGWRFTHDPAGSFRAMDFSPAVASMRDFRVGHTHLSTSASSPFVQYVIVQRRDATGADKLLGCRLTRVDASGTVHQLLSSRAEFFAAVGDVFGLDVSDLTEAEQDRLWQRANVRTAELT